jgi:hypothetical protein
MVVEIFFRDIGREPLSRQSRSMPALAVAAGQRGSANGERDESDKARASCGEPDVLMRVHYVNIR